MRQSRRHKEEVKSPYLLNHLVTKSVRNNLCAEVKPMFELLLNSPLGVCEKHGIREWSLVYLLIKKS